MHQRRSKLLNELPQQSPDNHLASARSRRFQLWGFQNQSVLQVLLVVLIIAIAALFFLSRSPENSRGMNQIAKQIDKLIRKSIVESEYQEALLEPLNYLNDFDDPVHKAVRWMARSDHHDVTLQRHALAVLYFGTGGDATWLSCSHRSFATPCREAHKVRMLDNGSSECDWFGVTCDEDGIVTRVAWTENGLTMQEWPMELLLLTNLELVWFSGNPGLTASLPTWIGNISNLRSLGLHDTQLQGKIPSELYTLTNLESLRLYNSNLIGTLSTNIGKLTKLSWLWLHGNQLTGKIPTQLGLLKKLTGLTVHQNKFDNAQDPPSQVCDLRSHQLEDYWTDCLDGTTDEPACACCTKCFIKSN